MAWLLVTGLGFLCVYVWRVSRGTRQICVMLLEYNEWLQKNLAKEWDMTPELLFKDYTIEVASCGMVPGLHQLEESLADRCRVAETTKAEAEQIRRKKPTVWSESTHGNP